VTPRDVSRRTLLGGAGASALAVLNSQRSAISAEAATVQAAAVLDFRDDFDGPAAPLQGRVSPSGHVWGDGNARFRTDGTGSLLPVDWATSGRYADVHLDAAAIGMAAVGLWTGTSGSRSDNSGLVLISGPQPERSGTPGSLGIYYNAIHPVFGDWATAIDLWVNGTGQRLLTYFYPGGRLAQDVPHRFGWRLSGMTMTFDMPDGTTKTLTDSRFPDWVGKHLIYQIYNSGHPANQPRYDSVAATVAGSATPRAALIYQGQRLVHRGQPVVTGL
jgi:hypothetical protein